MHHGIHACVSPSSPSVGPRRCPLSPRARAARRVALPHALRGARHARPGRRRARPARRPADARRRGRRALGARRARGAGVRVLNRPSALLAAHDKLLTAGAPPARACRTRAPACVAARDAPPPPDRGPVVVKPRFGSWGRDVVRCEDADELPRHLRSLASAAGSTGTARSSRSSSSRAARPPGRRRRRRASSARSSGGAARANGGRTSRSGARASRRRPPPEAPLGARGGGRGRHRPGRRRPPAGQATAGSWSS